MRLEDADIGLAMLRFFDSGGPVLYVLAALALCLWSLLLERFWFRWRDYPGLWRQARDVSNVADGLWRLCDARLALRQSLPLIKTLIALCPLVGLLGTVTGMIHLFDVMAVSGTANARLMASGVARATLPTLAGMVIAVSGLLSLALLGRWSQSQLRLLDDEQARQQHNLPETLP